MSAYNLSKHIAIDLVEYKKTKEECYLNNAAQMYSDSIEGESFDSAKALVMTFVNQEKTKQLCEKYIPLFIIEQTPMTKVN